MEDQSMTLNKNMQNIKKNHKKPRNSAFNTVLYIEVTDQMKFSKLTANLRRPLVPVKAEFLAKMIWIDFVWYNST